MTMVDTSTIADRLKIDCEAVIARVVDFIKEKMARQGSEGVLLGLSGGLDSAVVAALAVRATGDPRKVHTLHLYDSDSEPRSLQNARKVAQSLGIRLEAIEISKIQGQVKGAAPARKVSPLPRSVNRMLARFSGLLARLIFHESQYELALRRERPRNWLKNLVYAPIVDRVEGGFSSKHKLRRAILEDHARRMNLLLLGAANKSEASTGWFVKDGVDDLPLEPILGLYKTQVRQLGRCLNLPAGIVEQIPSPDMLRGLTDEMAIGFKYDDIDVVLYAMENGLDLALVYETGITRGQFEGIKKINELSAWKRESPHAYPSLG